MARPPTGDMIFLAVLLSLLLVLLALRGMETPASPVLAGLSPRPTPTATATPTPGWWSAVPFATPSLPALPGLPDVSLGGGSGSGSGPVSFQVLTCPDPKVRIAEITASGIWWLVGGTTQAEPFWYWKMELSPDGVHWTLLTRSETPVTSGRLMEFNTTTVPPGSYRFRLTAVKRDGNYPPPCEVTVGR